MKRIWIFAAVLLLLLIPTYMIILHLLQSDGIPKAGSYTYISVEAEGEETKVLDGDDALFHVITALLGNLKEVDALPDSKATVYTLGFIAGEEERVLSLHIVASTFDSYVVSANGKFYRTSLGEVYFAEQAVYPNLMEWKVTEAGKEWKSGIYLRAEEPSFTISTPRVLQNLTATVSLENARVSFYAAPDAAEALWQGSLQDAAAYTGEGTCGVLTFSYPLRGNVEVQVAFSFRVDG